VFFKDGILDTSDVIRAAKGKGIMDEYHRRRVFFGGGVLVCYNIDS